MSVSFLRIDDRMIHGQTVTRWSLEYPCDGLIAVNDKAATTDALKMAYKSASTKKTFVWTYEAWKKKNQKVLDSKDNYFLITKDPIQMKKILVDDGFVPSDVKKVIVGPCNDRPGAVKLGNNQSITQEEAEALEAISKAGYEIEFALIKEASNEQTTDKTQTPDGCAVPVTEIEAKCGFEFFVNVPNAPKSSYSRSHFLFSHAR